MRPSYYQLKRSSFPVSWQALKMYQTSYLTDSRILFLGAKQVNMLMSTHLHLVPTTTNRYTYKFDVHVTVLRVKFLIIKPTRCTNFSNLFLEWNSTCFRQFLCPSSGVFLLLTQQWYMSANLCDIYHCCVYSKNSWWWTEELSHTCRVSFQE